MDDTFAIVQTEDSELDVTGVARLITEPLQIAVADLVRALPHRFGILVENISKQVANRCIALLLEARVAARAVPQSAIVDPPEPATLRTGRPDDEVFFYVEPNRKGIVKWSDVVRVDLVSVQEASQKEFDDWEVTGYGEGIGVRRFKNRRVVVTRQPLFADVVSRSPWLLLRIPQEGFNFAVTGLPTFPTRRENLLALAAMIGARATAARLGPGLQWLGSRAPPREQRAQSQTAYRGFLRWQLTRLFLG